MMDEQKAESATNQVRKINGFHMIISFSYIIKSDYRQLGMHFKQGANCLFNSIQILYSSPLGNLI